MTETALYRHYGSDGTLLYVGISARPLKRTNAHPNQSDWRENITRIEIERLPWRWLAEEAEKTAIMVERPLHNVTYNPIVRDTPEASGTARKAPGGKAVSATAPMTDPTAVHSTRLAPSKSRAGARRLGSRGPAPGQGGRPRKGEEAKTLKATRPWEKEGISQATWYRRQKERGR